MDGKILYESEMQSLAEVDDSVFEKAKIAYYAAAQGNKENKK